MTDDTETTFAALPADIRLTVLSALEERIMFASSVAICDEAADVVTRLGYPRTAESARKVRAALATL